MKKNFIINSVLFGAFFALLMMLPVSGLFAQGSTTAALAGTVVDEKGQGLPGASVIAVHEPTGSRYGGSTRADGRYNIVNMRVGGPYKITVSFVGYKNAVQSGIVLTLAQELRQNFKLEVNQSQLEEVKVVASRSSIINSGRTGAISTNTPEFEEAEKNVRNQLESFFTTNGTKPVDYFHKKLGKIMWNMCGMARNKPGLEQAIADIRQLREDFYKNVKVPGSTKGMNPELEKAARVADFIELGELMCIDALDRNESCGGHFREEYQTEEGEALRDDEKYMYVAAWEFTGNPSEPKLNKEDLVYENIKVSARSYK